MAEDVVGGGGVEDSNWAGRLLEIDAGRPSSSASCPKARSARAPHRHRPPPGRRPRMEASVASIRARRSATVSSASGSAQARRPGKPGGAEDAEGIRPRNRCGATTCRDRAGRRGRTASRSRSALAARRPCRARAFTASRMTDERSGRASCIDRDMGVILGGTRDRVRTIGAAARRGKLAKRLGRRPR